MLYSNPRQLDRLSVYRDFLAVIIHHKPAGAIDMLGFCLLRRAEICISADLGFHTGQKLKWIERLRHIVIRTEIQSEHLVRILRLRRQHNDRNTARLTYLHHRMDAIQLRHHHIQQNQMYLLCL